MRSEHTAVLIPDQSVGVEWESVLVQSDTAALSFPHHVHPREGGGRWGEALCSAQL